MNYKAGSEIDEDVTEDTPRLCAEEANIVAVAEIVDFEGSVEGRVR